MRRHTQQSLLLCNLQLSIGLGHRPVCIPFLDWCPLFQIFVALRQELRGNKPTWQKEAKSPFLSKLLFLFSLTGQITGLPWWLNGKESPCDAEDAGYPGSVPGWGRFPGEGHGNPFGYSCLENSKDRGAWQATVHRVTKSQTQLKQLNTQDVCCHYCKQHCNEHWGARILLGHLFLSAQCSACSHDHQQKPWL